VILKQAVLRTKYYFILVFLLNIHATGVTLENLTTFIAISIYLANMDVEINCVFLKLPNLLAS